MLTRRSIRALAALALCAGLSACDEEHEAVCLAKGYDELALRLHQPQWQDGDYELRVFAGEDAEASVCRFTLPGTSMTCGPEDGETWENTFSIGATVDTLLIAEDAPERVRIELDGPDGETRAITVEPEYASYTFCGQALLRGEEIISLDDDEVHSFPEETWGVAECVPSSATFSLDDRMPIGETPRELLERVADVEVRARRFDNATKAGQYRQDPDGGDFTLTTVRVRARYEGDDDVAFEVGGCQHYAEPRLAVTLEVTEDGARVIELPGVLSGTTERTDFLTDLSYEPAVTDYVFCTRRPGLAFTSEGVPVGALCDEQGRVYQLGEED